MTTGLERLACAHLETTAPDEQGYVVCCACFSPLQRPMSMDELIDLLEQPKDL